MSVTREQAERFVDWLSNQRYQGENLRYQGENLLHAVVCCDYASRQDFIDAVERQLSRPCATGPATQRKDGDDKR